MTQPQMLNTSAIAQQARLTPLEAAVLESIAYSDIFDFPVTSAEVLRALPLQASLDEVEAALCSESLNSRLIHRAGAYYMLAGRGHLTSVRLSRSVSSRRLMRSARFYGSLLARLPFVRMVALTGSLAVENADDGDDIDYLIVTAPGRVWLARALTMSVVRLATLRGVTICPNYLLSEEALVLADQDRYTARELLQMWPLAGASIYGRMLDCNAWWRDYLPNAGPQEAPAGAGRPLLPRLVEALLPSRVADVLERQIFRRKAAELAGQAGGRQEAVFDATMCKGHFEGHRRRTAEALAERLGRLEASGR